MPTPRYGEAVHAWSEEIAGAEHASKAYPVKTPARDVAPAAWTLAGTSNSTASARTPRPLTPPRVPHACSETVKRLQQAVDLVAGVVVRDPGPERRRRKARAERHAVPVVGVPDP